MIQDFNLTSISTGLMETIINIGTSLANNMLNKILGAVGVLVPNFVDGLDAVSDLLELAFPSVVYCFDALLLSPLTIKLLISSLVFSITARPLVFVVKIIVKWWDRVFL